MRSWTCNLCPKPSAVKDIHETSVKLANRGHARPQANDARAIDTERSSTQGCKTVMAMGHLLGYARVSTTDQQPQLQVDALQRVGCYRVFTETASGARTDRPILEQVLDQLEMR
jgi:predicted site-specific integrase-resolvase